tara:strand:- start:38232 stop:38501 length:270 start_codon:yes stop_codon:yes gene_type:complete
LDPKNKRLFEFIIFLCLGDSKRFDSHRKQTQLLILLLLLYLILIFITQLKPLLKAPARFFVLIAYFAKASFYEYLKAHFFNAIENYYPL